MEGGWTVTVPSGWVILRAGILGCALARLLGGGQARSSFVSSVSGSSGWSRLRGEVDGFKEEVGSAIESMVVAGESVRRLRLRKDLSVVKLSSISVLRFVSRAESTEELSSRSSDLISTLPSWPRVNAEMVLAACLVERRTRLDGSGLKILVVSCETFDVRILAAQSSPAVVSHIPNILGWDFHP